MLLYEISDSPLVPKLIAVSDQLKTDLDDGTIKPELTLDQFMEYLNLYDINLDTTDLYNMIKKPPLNKLISNIQGDKIVFKGFNDTDAPKDDDNKIVQQMAKSALKK